MDVYLPIRAVVEARYLAGLINSPPPQNPGSAAGVEGVFIGALILTGYLSLAFWQIALGRWTLGRRP